MMQDRISGPTLLSIGHATAREVNFEDLID